MAEKMNPLQAAAKRRMPQMVIAVHVGHGEQDDEQGFHGESEPSETDIEDLGKLAATFVHEKDEGEECEPGEEMSNKPGEGDKFPPTSKPKDNPYPGKPMPSKPAMK